MTFTKTRRFLVYAPVLAMLGMLPACERESATTSDVGKKAEEEQPQQQQAQQGPGSEMGPVHRVELAAASIPPGREKPHVFKVLSVTVPPGEKIEYAAGEGMIFQISGSQTVTVNGQARTLEPNQGFHIETGLPATYQARKEEPSVFLHFLLLPQQQADRAIQVKSGEIHEIYRTPTPVPDLKAQEHKLTLAQLSFPPSTPEQIDASRGGASLYYVLSGTGVFAREGNKQEKQPGSIVYEPSGKVQWANPTETPLQLIVASLTPQESSAPQPGAQGS